MESDPWLCYVCTSNSSGNIHPRKDWENRLFALFKTTNILDVRKFLNFFLLRFEFWMENIGLGPRFVVGAARKETDASSIVVRWRRNW